jgi:hypothetical protein
MANVYNFIGDLQQLNTVYNAALLADAEKSADKTIRAQITATKISQTGLRSLGLPKAVKPSGGGINSTHLPPQPKKRMSVKLQTLRFFFFLCYHYYFKIFYML